MSGLLLVKKAPGIKLATVSHFEPGTKSCLRCPGATTTYSIMRGSTLLPHLREATHFSIQLRSALRLPGIADLPPSIGSLLPQPGYSSSSPLENVYICTELV